MRVTAVHGRWLLDGSKKSLWSKLCLSFSWVKASLMRATGTNNYIPVHRESLIATSPIYTIHCCLEALMVS